MSRALRWAGIALVAISGCVPLDAFRQDSDLAQVPTSPFPPSVVQTVKRSNLNTPPAKEDIAWRVDAVGRKLIAANPQAGLQPRFGTIGVAEPEIFHADQTIVYVTEGLVRQCRSEAELAAVLASELGKMVSEREAIALRETRMAEPRLPIALPIGTPGNATSADPSYFVEIAKFEKEHPKSARKQPLPAPDPQLIARTLLQQSGFQKTDLDAVAPILRNAERNCTLERQFKGMIVPTDPGVSWRAQ
jgi:hypothetical protein